MSRPHTGMLARPPFARRDHRAPIGVAVVIQARIDREALASLLATRPGIEVVGTASDLGGALQLCIRLGPRVVVLSTLVAGIDGVSATALLRNAAPATQVVALAPHGADRCVLLNPTASGLPSCSLLSSDDHVTCVEHALAHGALGALRRDASTDDLVAAVRAAAAGRAWVAPGLASRDDTDTALSPRERRVARLVGEGASNRGIADALGISEMTVKKHIGHALRKLVLHDRLQLGLAVARFPLAFRER